MGHALEEIFLAAYSYPIKSLNGIDQMRNVLAALLITIATQSSLALEKSDLNNLKELLAATDNEALASALVQHCLPMLEETPAQSDEPPTKSSKLKVNGELDFYCECALELKEVKTNAGFEVLYEDCTSAGIAANMKAQAAELEKKQSAINEIQEKITKLEKNLEELQTERTALLKDLGVVKIYPFKSISEKIVYLLKTGVDLPSVRVWGNSSHLQYVRGVLPKAEPEEQYNFALGLTMQNDLEPATAAFAEFLQINEGHPRMADALFWIGRILFLREDFEFSALTFAEFNAFYPEDARVVDTTMWIAEAVARFATANHACAVYAALTNFLEEPPDRFNKRLRELTEKANCDSKEIQKSISKPIPKPAAPVGIEDIARIQKHVSKCWQPPLGAAGNDTLKVNIFVAVNNQGNVIKAEIEDKKRYNLDSYFKASAIAAKRAIVECSPLPIPQGKYEQLKEFTFSFDPAFLSR